MCIYPCLMCISCLLCTYGVPQVPIEEVQAWHSCILLLIPQVSIEEVQAYARSLHPKTTVTGVSPHDNPKQLLQVCHSLHPNTTEQLSNCQTVTGVSAPWFSGFFLRSGITTTYRPNARRVWALMRLEFATSRVSLEPRISLFDSCVYGLHI